MPCLSQLFHLPFLPPFAGCLRVAFLAGAFFDRFCACFVAPFLAGADLAFLATVMVLCRKRLDVRVDETDQRGVEQFEACLPRFDLSAVRFVSAR